MATATCFEELDVWKLSMNLAIDIYKHFKECNDLDFKNQIQRACISIPSNIAEGYSRQTNKEFCQFLYIAKGSCAEVRTQVYLAKYLDYIENDVFIKHLKETEHISRMLYNLIKYRSSLKPQTPNLPPLTPSPPPLTSNLLPLTSYLLPLTSNPKPLTPNLPLPLPCALSSEKTKAKP